MKTSALAFITTAFVGLLPLCSPAKADPAKQLKPFPSPLSFTTSLSRSGWLRSANPVSPNLGQSPVLFIDNSQSTFSVNPMDYGMGKTNMPSTLNVRVGSNDGGCVILMSGDPGSTLKLSDIFIKAANTGRTGTLGTYYGSEFKPLSATPTMLWQSSEQNGAGSGFSLSFELRNLRTYPAGNYSTRLFFTVIGQ